MEVKGIMKQTVVVDITPTETLSALREMFGINVEDLELLRVNNPNNTVGVDALFICKDISYHGSPCYDYRLFSSDEVKVKAFELIKEIEKLHKKI